MREPINEGQVDRAYEALLDCLDRVDKHFRFCVGLQGKYPIGKVDEAIPLSAEDYKTIVDGMRGLRLAVEETERLLAPLERELPSVRDEPVSTRSVVAASWAEANMEVARAFVKNLEGWERFEGLPPSGQQQQFRACFNSLPDVPQIRASLKIERAKLRDRAVALNSDARFGHLLRELSKQPRLLMELLIRKEGKWVGYEEIGEVVWGDRSTPENRIHQVRARLRDELGRHGGTDIDKDIASESSAYRFR